MVKIIDFKETGIKKNPRRNRKPESRETVLLWQLSQEFDALLQYAIVDQKLPPEEVAAMLAHRLGTLISTTDSASILTEFCNRLISRLSSSAS